MFYVQTLICRPNKIIIDLSDLPNKINTYFIPIDHFHELRVVKHNLDFNYIKGAIQFKYVDQFLLDVIHWDLVDQLWAYLLNVIEKNNKILLPKQAFFSALLKGALTFFE